MKKKDLSFRPAVRPMAGVLVCAVLLCVTGVLFLSGCSTTASCLYFQTQRPAGDKYLGYEVSMPLPHTHYFEVKITVRKPNLPYIDVAMPAWSPGRYVIYDFAKHISTVSIHSENATPLITRIDKQTWRISGHDKKEFTIFYKIYANFVSGTFSHLSSEGALINGASVFMYLVRGENIPINLVIHLPEEKDWEIATSLQNDDKNMYHADDYEHLIDTPVSIGRLREYVYSSHNKPISIVFQSPEPDVLYEQRLAYACKLLCDTAGDMFGGLPFSEYGFIFHFGFGPGIFDGMEHMNSSCITDTHLLDSDERVDRMTTLAAHELFHVWNVKCIRPYEFMTYDLTKEIYTRSLWIVEGLTRHYQNILQLRAGFLTREKFRTICAGYISSYELKPGKTGMTLEQASLVSWFDRWSEEDSNRTNTRISYYNKGAVIGLLLDMKIRGMTAGQRGLDDVFRRMYDDYYKKNKGYTTEDFYSECENVAGIPLYPFFNRYVRGLDPLPYEEIADSCGFILKNRYDTSIPFIGIELSKTRITNIIPDSPAWIAGFQKNDVITSFDGNPFAGKESFSSIKPGQKMIIRFLRFDKEMTLPVVIGKRIPVSFIFIEKTIVDEETIQIREAFYTGRNNN